MTLFFALLALHALTDGLANLAALEDLFNFAFATLPALFAFAALLALFAFFFAAAFALLMARRGRRAALDDLHLGFVYLAATHAIPLELLFPAACASAGQAHLFFIFTFPVIFFPAISAHYISPPYY